MKITKQQLKRIIKEELLKEARDPVGPGPSAGELMGRARENFPPDVLARAGYGEEEPRGPHDPKELIEVGEGEIKLVYEPENEYITVEASWMDSYPQISIELLQEMYNALKEIGRI